jgi:hypothetical protein
MQRTIARAAAAALCLAAAAGCSRSYDRYIPSEDAARKALEAALDAWKGGQAKPGPVEGTSPPVQAVDSRWQAGQRLTGYEILEEEPSTGGPRVFSVRLTMPAPAAPATVRYYVVGRDPLWVYREDDYKLPAGM